MSTVTLNFPLATPDEAPGFGLAPVGPAATSGYVARVYVVRTEELAAAVRELGGQTAIVARDGRSSRVVHGVTRPVGRWRALFGRQPTRACGPVERTELSLGVGAAVIDDELDTDQVIVRTWSPRFGSELDQVLWWNGHRVAARHTTPRHTPRFAPQTTFRSA